jgi:hypothetical protein
MLGVFVSCVVADVALAVLIDAGAHRRSWGTDTYAAVGIVGWALLAAGIFGVLALTIGVHMGKGKGDQQGRPAPTPDPFAGSVTEATNRHILDVTVSMSQMQILAQVADEASIDGRTVGLLAFNGAVAGGTLAAKNLLGHYWFTPLPVALAATVPCLWSLLKKTSAFGPRALLFYEEFGHLGPLGSRTQMLADLDDTFKFNETRVRWKTLRLRLALGVLVFGLIVAGVLIAVVRPTTIQPCAREQIRVQAQDRPSLCLPRRDFRLLVPGASSGAVANPNSLKP